MKKLVLIAVLLLVGCSHLQQGPLETTVVGRTRDGCLVEELDLWYAGKGKVYVVRCPLEQSQK